MLSEVSGTEWEPEISVDGRRVYRASDFDTINRPAATCEDFAWALEITAGWLKDDALCVVATKRSRQNDAWLALCE